MKQDLLAVIDNHQFGVGLCLSGIIKSLCKNHILVRVIRIHQIGIKTVGRYVRIYAVYVLACVKSVHTGELTLFVKPCHEMGGIVVFVRNAIDACHGITVGFTVRHTVKSQRKRQHIILIIYADGNGSCFFHGGVVIESEFQFIFGVACRHKKTILFRGSLYGIQTYESLIGRTE